MSGNAPPDPDATPSGRFLARAAFLTAALTAAGSLLGLLRDQTIAHLFGAGTDTDAFLVAWTVPEVAATVLIEDAMALILVPAFSLALAHRARQSSPDPVRVLVRTTLPRLFLTLGVAAAVLVAAAPWVVDGLAPDLPQHQLAVDCTRLTGTCALSFGLAGYFSAALRAHGSFVAPAAIYIAYNIGIVVTMLLLPDHWGVRAAAAGVALGGVLMVVAQLPPLWRRLAERAPRSGADATDGEAAKPVTLALVAPVIVFALSRQSQVLIERFLAAPLPAGAISHLNYAQKVAQMPMTLSLMLVTVTFPVVARAMAAGETEKARDRVERDLALAAIIVLAGAAVVIAAAPQIIHILFQRGAFTPADTAATAAVMRVYALGLLGQALVGALARCYFSAARPLWYPAGSMLAGLAATVVAGAGLAHVWGACGIAAANALGITLSAALLLHGVRGRSVPVRIRHVVGGLARLTAAAAVATGAGWLCGAAIAPVLPGITVSCAVVVVVFLVLARAVRAPEIDTVLRPLTRKFRNVR